MNDGFFMKLWQGTAPLVLWAAHFFLCYLVAAAGCGPATMPVLVGATVLALAAGGWLLWRSHRRYDRSMLALAALGSAALGMVGIVWNALPLLAFGGC